MAKIGLRPYLFKVYNREPFTEIPYSASGDGAQLWESMDGFHETFSKGASSRSENRSLYLERSPDDGRSCHGVIRYGAFGVNSTFEDSEGKPVFERTSAHTETLPLYYRMYIPESGASGLAIFQSYENRSCTTLFINTLREYFELNNKHLRLTAKKLMPQPDEAVANAAVKKLKYYRRRVSGDAVENLDISEGDWVNVELVLTARRNSTLGRYFPLRERLAGGVLAYDGAEFDQAAAEIEIGGERRKVGLINVDGASGSIDVSSKVELKDGHPILSEVSREARALIASLRTQYNLT